MDIKKIHKDLVHIILSSINVHAKYGGLENLPEREELVDLVYNSMVEAGYRNLTRSDAYDKFLELISDKEFMDLVKKHVKFFDLSYNFVFHKLRMKIIQRLDLTDTKDVDTYSKYLDCLIKLDDYLEGSGREEITSFDLITLFEKLRNELGE